MDDAPWIFGRHKSTTKPACNKGAGACAADGATQWLDHFDHSARSSTFDAVARATIVVVVDLNQLAARLVKQATEPDEEPVGESAAQRNGRSGGRKGGAARAASLTPEKRSEIARLAAKARWAKSRSAG